MKGIFTRIGLIVVAYAIAYSSAVFAATDSNKSIGVSAITMSNEAIPFILDSKGDVWAFKSPLDVNTPIKLPNLHHIKKLAPYVALTEDGHVYTWGLSEKSKYLSPQNIEADYTPPQLIKELSHVSDVDAAGQYFVAVVDHEQVYEWGNKVGYGGKTTIISSPQLIYTHPAIQLIATSGHSTIIALDDHHMVGWGDNYQMQLGAAEPQTNVSPKQPVYFTTPESVSKVYMSIYHAVVQSENGRVFFWGNCLQKNNTKGAGIQAEIGIDDVKAAAINKLDDNIFPHAFIKNDGSVLLAYAPAPQNVEQCQSTDKVYDFGASTYRIEGMPIKAMAIATGGDGESPYDIIAVGEDHTLWGANIRSIKKGFVKIPFVFY